jgi:hypothetical protein
MLGSCSAQFGLAVGSNNKSKQIARNLLVVMFLSIMDIL